MRLGLVQVWQQCPIALSRAGASSAQAWFLCSLLLDAWQSEAARQLACECRPASQIVPVIAAAVVRHCAAGIHDITTHHGSLAFALQVGPVTAAAMVAEHGNAILEIMDSPDAVDMLQRWVPACQRDELHSGERNLGTQMQWARWVILLPCFGASPLYVV